MDNYDHLLTPADFAPLVSLLDLDAGLDAYTHLSGNRIVHIYSHGWAWPHSWSIEEVYLMTGETWMESLYEKYWREFHSGDLPLVKELRGPAKIFVSPAFIAAHNSFSNLGTLFYGGFCFSFLGSWPTVITEKAHAAGYMGFNWSVYTNWNAAWNQNLMKKMLDVDREISITPALWLSDESFPKQYWYDRGGFWVSVRYQGDPALRLVDPPECSDTEMEEAFSGYAQIHVFTGAPQGTKVSYRYGKVHCDGHVKWTESWEGEIGYNGEYWGAMLGVLNIENYQDVVIAQSTIMGVTREAYMAGTAFRGSGIFFPVEMKVKYY